MAKLVLNIDAMQEDFFADTAMVGIASAAQGYRLCWLLNNHFEMDLERSHEHTISSKKKDHLYSFPVYQYVIPNSCYKHMIYKLKDGGETLLPETRQLDYLWTIQTAYPEHDVEYIMRELRKMPEIQLASLLSSDQLKSVRNLLL